MTERKTHILVTGVGGRSVGHQILQALLLADDKYRITVTDADPFSYGLFQVKHRYIVPKATDPAYMGALTEIVKNEEIQVILPGTEIEVEILTKNRKAFEQHGCIIILNPSDVVNICCNKWKLYQWLKKNNFGTPKTVLSSNWQDLVKKTGFPIVAKPSENSGGSRNVALIKNKSEVEQYLQDTEGIETIFQEYVGDAETEYTVGVMIANDGELIDSIVVQRKLTGLSLGSQQVLNGRPYTLSTGYSQGYITRHPLIQQVCENLSLQLGMRGPANIQCRLEGSHVKIFEVHPRFSGTTSIRASVGFNEPDLLVRNALFNEQFGRLDYQTDVAAIRAFQHLIVPVSDLGSVPMA